MIETFHIWPYIKDFAILNLKQNKSTLPSELIHYIYSYVINDEFKKDMNNKYINYILKKKLDNNKRWLSSSLEFNKFLEGKIGNICHKKTTNIDATTLYLGLEEENDNSTKNYDNSTGDNNAIDDNSAVDDVLRSLVKQRAEKLKELAIIRKKEENDNSTKNYDNSTGDNNAIDDNSAVDDVLRSLVKQRAEKLKELAIIRKKLEKLITPRLRNTRQEVILNGKDLPYYSIMTHDTAFITIDELLRECNFSYINYYLDGNFYASEYQNREDVSYKVDTLTVKMNS